jgi:surfeit locus 1 family protein
MFGIVELKGGTAAMVVTRSGVLATVVVLVAVAVCIRLGFWQLDRRAQRMEHNAAVAERLAAPPMDLATAPMDTTGLPNRVAMASGVFDHDRTIILGGRSYRGAPGVYVLTPLQVAGGAILVNRGWLPSPDASTVDLAAIHRTATATVTGVLVPFPDVRLPPSEEGFRTRWIRLDGAAIRAQYPYHIAPIYLQATGSPAADIDPEAGEAGPGRAALTPVPLDPPALDGGSHLSYAVQWFSFATIFLVGWAVMVLRQDGRPTPSGRLTGRT